MLERFEEVILILVNGPRHIRQEALVLGNQQRRQVRLRSCMELNTFFKNCCFVETIDGAGGSTSVEFVKGGHFSSAIL